MTSSRDTGHTLFDVAGAVLSPDRLYRYDLWRVWGDRDRPNLCGWIMLNPSTADEGAADPTLRRCIGYARRWGFDGLRVRNLFAYRTTQPRHLAAAADPYGPDNDAWLTGPWPGVTLLVAAWGNCPTRLQADRARAVTALLTGRDLHCVATGRDGQPCHPLYQRAALTAQPWAPR